MCRRTCWRMLTDDVQLHRAVFDAAAVPRHARVFARVVRGDIGDQQGAVGHLLQPGQKTVAMRVAALTLDVCTSLLHPSIIDPTRLLFFFKISIIILYG